MDDVQPERVPSQTISTVIPTNGRSHACAVKTLISVLVINTSTVTHEMCRPEKTVHLVANIYGQTII